MPERDEDVVCLRRVDVDCFLQGELSPGETKLFQEHLGVCPLCCKATAERRELLAWLATAKHNAPGGTTYRILAAVDAERKKEEGRRAWAHKTLAMAAAVSLLLGIGGLLHFSGSLQRTVSHSTQTPAAPTPADPIEVNGSLRSGLAWLCTAQEPDGSWSPSRWGGDVRFTPALTGLPLLALAEGGAWQQDPEQREVVRRACESLCLMQAESGRFGAEFQAASYNQGLATLALLRVYKEDPQPSLKPHLDRAIRLILDQQTESGGWGYLYTPLPNVAISLWHLQCLQIASTLDWPEVKEPLARGLQWQRGQEIRHAEFAHKAGTEVRDEEGMAQTPSSLPEIDYCETYFAVLSWRQSHDAGSLERLAAIRQGLAEMQVHEGGLAGSWGLNDRWSRVGGRLYTTSLAALAMR